MMKTPENILKSTGIKSTIVRKKILDSFISNGVAISNQDLENNLPDLDRVTVYRTLLTFEEKGIIHKVNDGTGSVKYAMCHYDCSEHHHQDEHIHFHCTQCDHTICLDDTEVPSISLPDGYKMESCDIIIKGICKNCH